MVFLFDVHMTGKSAAAIFAYQRRAARGTGSDGPVRTVPPGPQSRGAGWLN
jgi:hypothetical protein